MDVNPYEAPRLADHESAPTGKPLVRSEIWEWIVVVAGTTAAGLLCTVIGWAIQQIL